MNIPIQCQVCGDLANAHNHYGAIVCFSCRAFFRRGSNKGSKAKFVCNNQDEKCEITVATRKRCLLCRYKKCLEVGMRPDWVMSDEDKVEMWQKWKTESKSMTNYEERML